MSAPEQTQGVLLRYAGGGEVYAIPTADRHVWRVAGVEVHVGIVATNNGAEVIGLETPHSLAGAAHALRMAREAAEHARVALEMERAPKRPTKAKRAPKRPAKRTGKAKGRAKR